MLRFASFGAAAVLTGLGLSVGGSGTGATRTDAALGAKAGRTDAAVGAPDAAAQRTHTIGRSVRGRAIDARVVGDPAAPRSVLVVGCIHGTERAGEAVTKALRGSTPPVGTNWWVIDQVNPDGCRARTRQNARGVDLNRNADWRWRRGVKGDTFYPGTRAWSEPETRAIRDLVRELRPAASVWFHQHARLVDLGPGDNAAQRRYARTVGLPARDYGTVRGSITSWQGQTRPSAPAFVVELATGPLSGAAIARHVRAVKQL